ncbi:hypothetical protein Pan44_20510 [Caulifigura coniformis]|uniref:DnaJ homologue subfamily C member 28 conserved domain-containing protein n=2 Tax=Caulifigura coniformis TaxID=2527983 RepID=A0A517SD19_9PLAN|nr:hypothetical protein Pan44_20510 [Caulifigura coniformis]
MSWESFAERRIREAMDAGQFDNLAGAGKPIPGIDDPPDDDWWIRQKLKDEGLSIVPPILEARRELERTLAELPRIGSEAEVRRRLEKVNQQVREAIASPHPGPAVVVLPVDVDEAVARWKAPSGGALPPSAE